MCDSQILETGVPLISAIEDRERPSANAGRTPQLQTQQKKIGEMVVQLFRLPPLPGIAPDELPQSLEECLRGMRHVNWHKVTYHEGVLTQNGGDCKVRKFW